MLQTPLTLSLPPSDGERGAEGRVRGLPANPIIVIGKWYKVPRVPIRDEEAQVPRAAVSSFGPSGRNSKSSPGWQLRCWQMASSVEKRMALALPVLRMDRFCGVMSTASARSLSRILRWARTTSRLTMMGIGLDRQFLFLLKFLRFFQQPRDKDKSQTGEQIAAIPSPGTGLVVDCSPNLLMQNFKRPKDNPPLAGGIQVADCFRVEQTPFLEAVKESEQMQRDHETKHQRQYEAALQAKRRRRS